MKGCNVPFADIDQLGKRSFRNVENHRTQINVACRRSGGLQCLASSFDSPTETPEPFTDGFLKMMLNHALVACLVATVL